MYYQSAAMMHGSLPGQITKRCSRLPCLTFRLSTFICDTGSEQNSRLYTLLSLRNYLVGDVKTHCSY